MASGCGGSSSPPAVDSGATQDGATVPDGATVFDASDPDAAVVPLTCGSATQLVQTTNVIYDVVADATDLYWLETDRNTMTLLRHIALPSGAPQTITTSAGSLGSLALDAQNLYWQSDLSIHRVARSTGIEVTLWSDAASVRPLGLVSSGSNLYFGLRNQLVFVPASATTPQTPTEICHLTFGPIGALLDGTNAVFSQNTAIYTVPLTARGVSCGSPQSNSVLVKAMVLDGTDVVMTGQSTLFSNHSGLYRAARAGGNPSALYNTNFDISREIARIGSRVFWVVDRGTSEQVVQGSLDGSAALTVVAMPSAPVGAVTADGTNLYYAAFDELAPKGLLCRLTP